MWYVVQTPVGREAEAAEKLNHFYRDKAEKPCFVLSKERTWRMGGRYGSHVSGLCVCGHGG